MSKTSRKEHIFLVDLQKFSLYLNCNGSEDFSLLQILKNNPSIHVEKSLYFYSIKVGDCNRGDAKAPFLNSFNTKV